MLLGGILVSNAQQTLTPASRMALRQMRATQQENAAELYPTAYRKVMGRMPQNQVSALVKLQEGAEASALEEAGAQVITLRGGFAVVSMPLNDVERIAAHPAVRVMDCGTPYQPHLINARKATGIDKIHRGEGLPQAYTGKGIVAGIVDTGIDPNHINFKDAAGLNRVKMFANVTLNQLTGEVKVDTLAGRKLELFSTDTKELNHGTHTMGIMVGNYRGELSYGTANFDTHEIGTTVGENPYYGIATGSDIAAAGTPYLLPQTMALGMDAILGYAWGKGDDTPDRRTVINMSIGTNMGPHDGTDLINQYIDAIMPMDNPIIVLSAGNEGDMNVRCSKTLTEENTTVMTFLKGLNDDLNYPNYCSGGAQVWSDTEEPIDVQVIVYNTSRKKVAKRIVLPEGNTDGQYWASSSKYAQEGDLIDDEFGKYFHGLVGLVPSLDPESGRFCYNVDFTVWNNIVGNLDEKYMVGIEAKGKAGQRIDMYCNSASGFTQFTNYSNALQGVVPGAEDGTADGSISSMACGKNTIVVGSYNTKDHYVVPNVNNETAILGYEQLKVGDMSYFTSYGTLTDGTTRPHICAPGALIVSSNNRYYETYPYEIAATTDGTRPYTWVGMQGTSQAAPHVAGALTLWLEADPTLTVQECKDIIQQTAVRDEFVETGIPAQWGAGKFDAYEGLKEVLRRATGIKGVQGDSQRLILTPKGLRTFSLFLAGADMLKVEVFNLNGMRVHAEQLRGDEGLINLQQLPKGTYVIRVNGQGQKVIL